MRPWQQWSQTGAVCGARCERSCWQITRRQCPLHRLFKRVAMLSCDFLADFSFPAMQEVCSNTPASLRRFEVPTSLPSLARPFKSTVLHRKGPATQVNPLLRMVQRRVLPFLDRDPPNMLTIRHFAYTRMLLQNLQRPQWLLAQWI